MWPTSLAMPKRERSCGRSWTVIFLKRRIHARWGRVMNSINTIMSLARERTNRGETERESLVSRFGSGTSDVCERVGLRTSNVPIEVGAGFERTRGSPSPRHSPPGRGRTTAASQGVRGPRTSGPRSGNRVQVLHNTPLLRLRVHPDLDEQSIQFNAGKVSPSPRGRGPG